MWEKRPERRCSLMFFNNVLLLYFIRFNFLYFSLCITCVLALRLRAETVFRLF